MLINCGACENLRELLSLHANTRAIVVDSHRPIHHRHAPRNTSLNTSERVKNTCLQGNRGSSVIQCETTFLLFEDIYSQRRYSTIEIQSLSAEG